MNMSVTIITALLLAACSPAYAGGLAPTSSPLPVQRPSYAPLMEVAPQPQLPCRWPVMAADGLRVLYWNNDPDCYVEPVDGDDTTPQVDTPVTQPEVTVKEPEVKEPEEETPQGNPCKSSRKFGSGGGC